MHADLLRRSRLAFGIASICVLFLTETAVAHRTAPSAASPWVWSGLGLVALGALACGLWWGRQARVAARQPTTSSGRR